MRVQSFAILLLCACGEVYHQPVVVEGSHEGSTTSYDYETTNGIQTVTSLSTSEDSASDSSSTPKFDLSVPECGNYIIDQHEDCDRGELNNNFSWCTEDCKYPVCGDGYRQTNLMINGVPYNEDCDDGLEGSINCSPDCEDIRCGNGKPDPLEECDDGLENNGPGQFCNSQCKKNICGDGDKSPDEQCDDGNNDPFDGCHTEKIVHM